MPTCYKMEAEECGLPMLPYVAGFFLSIPAKNPDAICDKLHEDNIFAVPLAAGVRIAVCAVPLKKIAGMAAKVQGCNAGCRKISIDNNQRPELKKFRSFFP